ncbi:PLCD3 [Cervus elaphus hippelaphus]|uniref:Phosphoinositide phospholipase C n=1 Tax=Cervus elaphus hippelaphus TaxID=46360 RepID=A0A212D6W3_CEREH|nr:PLCD3 [Cervus elaphus hippelaphus]
MVSRIVNDGEARGLSEDEDVRAMLRGSRLCKIRSRTWQKERLYRLQEDGMSVWFQRRIPLFVQHIDAIREGHQSEGLRHFGGAFEPARCLTIAFKGRRKNLDLVAPTAEEAQRWVRDSNQDSQMSFKEIKNLLRMVNVDMNDMYAYRLFKECDHSKNERLEGPEIEEFLRRLLKRPELEEIFHRYSGEDRVLSAPELLEFLEDQGEPKQHELMTLDGFMMYLLSPEGDALDPAHTRVFQDMDQPLAHYFVSSSHNTYLTDSQIGGPSSTEAYVRYHDAGVAEVSRFGSRFGGDKGLSSHHGLPGAYLEACPLPCSVPPTRYFVHLSVRRAFAQGCRCVELDCWEGPGGEPVIYHGHTLTSKILFRDVIQAVREHAFTVSPYPVILSLENHCGLEQQAAMARHLHTILGDMLVTQTLDSQNPEELPSPERLKGRILVKGKKMALNFQTPGYEMDLNAGRFLVNGQCGYVLKPACLRQPNTTFDPECPGPPRTTLTVQVLTAQQLPKLNAEKPNSIVDPLVRIEIHGVPADCARKETNYVLNNGFNPRWGQTLQFQLRVPELALVRFVVEDYDVTSPNDFVGQFTLPLSSLKQGYRHIHLLSKDGASLSPATLFVHICIRGS